ncbi:putative adenylate cyclase [Paratrimastix pyriformis]|uniref:Adenylate cyclase n=1 Tax=Paratrimastix pyriformis TaxID=342808 RepID=A0ABQ8U6P8_9EUKA|nr:putative adenylate cyclase [Paratrimastix pyriformis]
MDQAFYRVFYDDLSIPLDTLILMNNSFLLGAIPMNDTEAVFTAFSSMVMSEPSIGMLALCADSGAVVGVRMQNSSQRFLLQCPGSRFLQSITLDFDTGLFLVEENEFNLTTRPWYPSTRNRYEPWYRPRVEMTRPTLLDRASDVPAYLVDLCALFGKAQNITFTESQAPLVLAQNATGGWVLSECVSLRTPERAARRAALERYFAKHKLPILGKTFQIQGDDGQLFVRGQRGVLHPDLNVTIWVVTKRPKELSFIAMANWIAAGIAAGVLLLAFLAGLGIGRTLQIPLHSLRSQMELLSLSQIHQTGTLRGLRFREVAEMQQTLDVLKHTFSILYAYLPHPVIRNLMAQVALDRSPAVARQFICIFFCDVVRFTALSESLSLPRLQWVVNCFLTVVYDVIARYQGTIDKFMGDAVLAFWNAPLPTAEPELHACECALALQGALDEVLAPVLASQGVGPMRVRVGLHEPTSEPTSHTPPPSTCHALPALPAAATTVGEAMVGNVGSELRMDYTVLGDPVNVASRLEQLNKVLGTAICISDKVAEAVSETMHVRPLGMAFLKNRVEGVVVYELVGRAATVTAEQRRLTELQTTLVELLGTGDFTSALQAGEDLLEEFPSYIPAQIMMRNARALLGQRREGNIYADISWRGHPPAAAAGFGTADLRGGFQWGWLGIKTEATPRVISRPPSVGIHTGQESPRLTPDAMSRFFRRGTPSQLSSKPSTSETDALPPYESQKPG